MNTKDIRNKLFELRDEGYAKFQAALTPGIDEKLFIGVRVPVLRKYAKEICSEGHYEEFLNTLPHKYYDENMLHAILISEEKDYKKALELVEAFLPYIDNWAVCDTTRPKVFKKNRQDLIKKIKKWMTSKETYTYRFGCEMLMNFYLDDCFEPEYLELPAKKRSSEYYVNMMTAWFFATALSKQWDESVKYIENKRLDVWTHNKTIQKARESFRITKEQKEYLKSLKI